MDKHLTAFLIAYSFMFTAHYILEPTWNVNEPKPWSLRSLFNYAVGTIGICIALIYLHRDLIVDLLYVVSGAGLGTVIAHARDYMAAAYKKDKADGLIEDRQKKP